MSKETGIIVRLSREELLHGIGDHQVGRHGTRKSAVTARRWSRGAMDESSRRGSPYHHQTNRIGNVVHFCPLIRRERGRITLQVFFSASRITDGSDFEAVDGAANNRKTAG